MGVAFLQMCTTGGNLELLCSHIEARGLLGLEMAIDQGSHGASCSHSHLLHRSLNLCMKDVFLSLAFLKFYFSCLSHTFLFVG